MAVEGAKKTIIVAFVLCFVCSILVSTAAVYLKPKQEGNKQSDRKTNILQAAGMVDPSKSVDETFRNVETRVIDMTTGEYSSSVKPDDVDEKKMVKTASTRIDLDQKKDLAKIRKIAKYRLVYLVKTSASDPNPGMLKLVVLPIHGKGLWSTMYGFLALEGDLRTIKGLGFYEHGETPGLGGEVDNPAWKALWKGKMAYDQNVNPRISVIKGSVDTTRAGHEYQVDGLSGATITSRGVSNMLKFWLGPDGYGTFLNHLRAEYKIPVGSNQAEEQPGKKPEEGKAQ